jgi:hypothetical protein
LVVLLAIAEMSLQDTNGGGNVMVAQIRSAAS